MGSQCEEKAFSSTDLLSGCADKTHTEGRNDNHFTVLKNWRKRHNEKKAEKRQEEGREVKPSCRGGGAGTRLRGSRVLTAAVRLWVKHSFLLGQYQPTPPSAGQATPYLAFRKSLWPVLGSVLSLWCLYSLFGTTMVPWYIYICLGFLGDPIYKGLLGKDPVCTLLINTSLQVLNWYSFPRHRRHLAEMGQDVKPAELKHHKKSKAFLDQTKTIRKPGSNSMEPATKWFFQCFSTSHIICTLLLGEGQLL